MGNISLTASMRSNLLSLQNTQSLMDTTQNRLSSGLKVNSAIDNPSSYYTATSLNNRANDLGALMDSMGQGIQTLKAADEAIKSITKFAEQAKAVANSAREVPNNMKEKITSTSKVSGTDSFTGSVVLDGRADMGTISLGAISGFSADTTMDFYIDGKKVSVGGATSAAFKTNLETAMAAEGFTVNATATDTYTITSTNGKSISYALPATDPVIVAGGGDAAATVTTVNNNIDGVIAAINANANLNAEINADGRLQVTATQTGKATEDSFSVFLNATIGEVKGFGGKVDTVMTDQKVIQQREKYAAQFDGILGQIDQLAKDAGYKGVNLLQENDLKVIFNEDRSSILDIKGKNASSAGLGMNRSIDGWNKDSFIDASVTEIEDAISELRTMASEFGNNYSVVQNREEFTKNVINVLTEGADKLTLADMNEESANMLALQTRQQLAINSLSLASQAAQSVLKLF